jgi:hypothetical protein
VISFDGRLPARAPAWVWLIFLAAACGVVPVVLACTDHDRCTNSDPFCVYHSYTLVQKPGPWILGLVAVPLMISLMVGALLRSKTRHFGRRADRAAWVLAVLDCFIAFFGMLVAGLTMLAPAALTVCAVAAAPSAPDPNDRLNRSGGVLGRLRPLD